MSLVEFPPHLVSQPVEKWAEWFFDRRASATNPKNDLFADECEWLEDSGRAASEALLQRLAELHERYDEWARVYSAAQLNQGLWGMFSYPCFLGQLFFDSDLPFDLRGRAMRSLVTPYRVYVVGWNPGEEMPNGWFMLWDLVFNDKCRGRMADVALDCLKEILALPDPRCQGVALHGLNHLDHPDRPAIVQRWINRFGNQGWDRRWLEDCRDGKAM